MAKKIRTLLFSTLYPSLIRPNHGIFVETRLKELLKSGEVETQVVAPVPWFPFTHPAFGEYSQFAATPFYEERHGVSVFHPRYLLLPKIGMNSAPFAMAHSALPLIKKIISKGFDFDLIDAHYYYPDGVAASIIAKQLNKPLIITARGTDLNLIPQYKKPRSLILGAAAYASTSAGVCKALMDTLEALGAEPEKLQVWRNGVDLERFHPVDREIARQHLGIHRYQGKILLSVGHLIQRKGHHLAIEAMNRLPADTELIIIGSGPEEKALRAQIAQLGLEDRIKLVGQIENKELKWWYSAADALALCSDREGWANVLLEAMACGTPVIATNIWGTPEVVATPDAGQLMPERTPEGLHTAFRALFSSPPQRSATRRYAENFSWQATTEAQLSCFRKIIEKNSERKLSSINY